MSEIRMGQIVFSQADEGEHQPWSKLRNVDGIVVHGPTTESILEAAEYLAAWDYGNGADGDTNVLRDALPDEDRWIVRPSRERGHYVTDGQWRILDDTDRPLVGDYVIYAHRKLDYVGMEVITSAAPENDRPMTLDEVSLVYSGDTDHDVVCELCGTKLCTAEASDTLGVLVGVYVDHVKFAHQTTVTAPEGLTGERTAD